MKEKKKVEKVNKAGDKRGVSEASQSNLKKFTSDNQPERKGRVGRPKGSPNTKTIREAIRTLGSLTYVDVEYTYKDAETGEIKRRHINIGNEAKTPVESATLMDLVILEQFRKATTEGNTESANFLAKYAVVGEEDNTKADTRRIEIQIGSLPKGTNIEPNQAVRLKNAQEIKELPDG